MTTTTQPTADGIGGADRAQPELLTVRDVAAILAVSSRHVYRQCDAGRLPRPVRIGAAVRWRRADVLAWLDADCPPVRSMKGGAR